MTRVRRMITSVRSGSNPICAISVICGKPALALCLVDFARTSRHRIVSHQGESCARRAELIRCARATRSVAESTDRESRPCARELNDGSPEVDSLHHQCSSRHENRRCNMDAFARTSLWNDRRVREIERGLSRAQGIPVNPEFCLRSALESITRYPTTRCMDSNPSKRRSKRRRLDSIHARLVSLGSKSLDSAPKIGSIERANRSHRESRLRHRARL